MLLYCSELATFENALFAFDPINRIVPTTSTRITASITAYSAISCPSSSDQILRINSDMRSLQFLHVSLVRGKNRHRRTHNAPQCSACQLWKMLQANRPRYATNKVFRRSGWIFPRASPDLRAVHFAGFPQRCYFRRSPSTLRKKLAKMVCTPSVRATAAGITIRIVRE
jgi:hypothetical protein